MAYYIFVIACASIIWAHVYDRVSEHNYPLWKKFVIPTVFATFAVIPVAGAVIAVFCVMDSFKGNKP